MNFRKFAVLGCLVTLAACGSSGSSSSSSDEAAITDVGSLPKATSPVVGADGSLSVLPKSLTSKSVSKMALGDYSNDAFDGTESRAACEAGNVLKEAVSSAAQGDLILCYVQNVMQQNIDSGNLTDNSIDPYDGEFHVYELAFDESEEEGDGQGPSKVRMKITKDAAGSITDFVMQACGDGGDPSAQSEYLHQAIDGSSFTMNTKGVHTDDMGTSLHQVDVTGTLNSSGQFTDKEISIASTWDREGEQGGNSSGTVTQDASTFTFTGSQAGTHDGGSYSNQVYFQAVVDDANEDLDNYDIGLLGYGEGSVNAVFSGTFDSDLDEDSIAGNGDDENYEDPSGESWDNDLNITASNDLTETVAAATLPDAIADGDVSIAFTGDEVYDCSGDAEAILTVDQAALDTSCTALSLGHNWTSCHEIFDN